MYALQGKEIPFPKDDLLFVDYHVYDYFLTMKFLLVLSIYLIKTFRAVSQKYLESIKEKIPFHIANIVENNAKFY